MATKTKMDAEPLRTTLVGVPGVTGDVHPVCATSRTNAIEWLRAGEPISAASDNGCLDVVKDDDGLWLCIFQRRMVTLGMQRFKHLAAVDQWLREWWPKLRCR